MRIKNFKILLTNSIEGINFEDNMFSIELGSYDNIRHFTHPCNNTNMDKKAKEGAIIYISDFNANILIGIKRLLDFSYPYYGGEVEILQNISNGNVAVNKDDCNLLYYIGVSTKAKQLNFPSVQQDAQDVTDIIKKILNFSKIHMDVVRLGEKNNK